MVKGGQIKISTHYLGIPAVHLKKDMYRHLKWKVVKSVSQSKNERAVACKLQNFETCSTRRGLQQRVLPKNHDNQLLSNLFSSLRVAEACYIREQPGMSELLHRAPLETSFIILQLINTICIIVVVIFSVHALFLRLLCSNDLLG